MLERVRQEGLKLFALRSAAGNGGVASDESRERVSKRVIQAPVGVLLFEQKTSTGKKKKIE